MWVKPPHRGPVNEQPEAYGTYAALSDAEAIETIHARYRRYLTAPDVTLGLVTRESVEADLMYLNEATANRHH